MTAQILPTCAKNVVSGLATATAAADATTAATNKVLILTADAAGLGVEVRDIGVMLHGTVTLHRAMLFRSADNGVTMHLCAHGLVSAYTDTTTTAPSALPVFTMLNGSAVSAANPLQLAAGERLYGGITVAQAAGVGFVAAGVAL